MHRASAIALIALLALGCGSRSDPAPPGAVASAPAAATPPVGVAITAGERVPLTISFTITPAGDRAQRFAADGDGECHHFARPADHAGIEWEVLYRGKSGPGIRMLILKTSPVADSGADAVDMQLDAGDAMRLIRAGGLAGSVVGAAHPGRAHVSVSARHTGERFAVDGVFSDGARIGGTIECGRVSSES